MLPQGTIVGSALVLALICSVRAQFYVDVQYPGHVQVQENIALGTVVATVTDKGYAITRIATIAYQGSDQGFYAEKADPNDPTSTTWNIILNRQLDYETQRDVQASFLASAAPTSDPLRTIYSTHFSIEFHVEDVEEVNDNAPKCQNLP